MAASVPRSDFLADLEARQEESLRLLDELDAKILAVLEEFSPKPANPRVALHEASTGGNSSMAVSR